MKPRLFLAASLFALAVSVANAGLDEGKAAYERKDYATAISELQSLAEQGNADAESYLGLMYATGRGVTKDDAQALKWFRKAAEQNNALAQTNIGYMYEQGLGGVGRDLDEARKWYRKAAEQGNDVAKKNLERLIASAIAGPDAGQRKYAVLSLIGDSLTVVTYRPSIGSQIDRNDHKTFALPDAIFDQAALLAVDEALRKVDPKASTTLLAPSSPTLRAEQGHLLDGQRFAPSEGLDGALKKDGATHLLLVTKHRADTNLQTGGSTVGSGKLEGLGYYIDRQLPMYRSDTGEQGVGFLAPYVYFKISLIDLATSTVLKQHTVTATTTLSAARARSKESFDPWDVLSPSQKIDTLRGMIRREIVNAVPALIQSK